MQTDDEKYANKFNAEQQFILIFRRIELGIGCLILLFIVAHICKKRLYNYNTTKLFMFCVLFYFAGMFVVLIHDNSYISDGFKFSYDDKKFSNSKNFINNILFDMIYDRKSAVFCGLQAFLNLFFYNVGYFCSVLVAYYVYCVINDDYRNFMTRVFKKKRVIFFFVFSFFVYLLPFIFLAFINTKPTNPSDSWFFYAYGPSGFQVKVGLEVNKVVKQRIASLIFYCGVCVNPLLNNQFLFTALSLINIFSIPAVLFFIHVCLFCKNNSRIKEIQFQQFKSPKQDFLLKSGKLSFLVFFIQLLHFAKILLLYLKNPVLNITINFIFDLYPLLMLVFYLKLTFNERRIQYYKSTILSGSEE